LTAFSDGRSRTGKKRAANFLRLILRLSATQKDTEATQYVLPFLIHPYRPCQFHLLLLLDEWGPNSPSVNALTLERRSRLVRPHILNIGKVSQMLKGKRVFGSPQQATPGCGSMAAGQGVCCANLP